MPQLARPRRKLAKTKPIHRPSKKEESTDENLQSAASDNAGGLPGWRRLIKATGLRRDRGRSAVADWKFHSGLAAGWRAIVSIHGQTRGQPGVRIGRTNPPPGLCSRRITRQSGCRVHVFRAADLAGAG